MAYRAYFDEKRTYGIEIECYGLSRPEVVHLLMGIKIPVRIADNFSANHSDWIVATDGTIKQNYPIEIISPPLQGLNGFKIIDKVCRALQDSGVQVDESCGLHIHHHVSDFSGRSTVNLLFLYAKYEKILDNLFSFGRREDRNENCRSLIKNGDIKWIYSLNKPFFYQAPQIALEFEKTQRLEGTTSFPSARHHKVNLCAINKYHTIEFRQHHGSFNFEEIKNWIVLSQQLINRAKNSTVLEGVSTWESFIRTLALTDGQLNESLFTPDKKLLFECREFYRERYKKNKYEEYADRRNPAAENKMVCYL